MLKNFGGQRRPKIEMKMKLLIPILALVAAPLVRADNPGNYPGQVTQTAANQVKAQAGDRTCTFTGIAESIVIVCNDAATGQSLSTTASFSVGSCHSGTFLTPNISWNLCRLKNPKGPNTFEFSFDVIANLVELTGDIFD